MQRNEDKQRYLSREPEPIPYWTPGRKGFILGATLTALVVLFLLWTGWIKPSWM